MNTKQCSKCKETKLLDEFLPRKERGPDHYHSYCKVCFRSYKRKWEAEEYKDPIKRKKRLKLNRINKKKNHRKKMEWILTYLEEHPCVDCDETDPLVLEFDHQKDKDSGVCQLIHDNKTLTTVQQEVKKCVVRCANCHRRKTAKDFNHLKYRLLQERKQE